VDGTLVRSNIVMYYFLYRLDRLKGWRRSAWAASFAWKAPLFWTVDQFHRTTFKRWFYRHYAGVRADDFRAWCEETYPRITEPRIHPRGLRAIDEHRSAGRKILLVTGGIEETVAPLARAVQADGFLSNRLEVHDGRFTGRLIGTPLAGAGKVEAIRKSWPEIDLSGSYAYGDSISDSPILSAVGHPVVVNPGAPLRLRSRKAGWPIECWQGVARGASQQNL
jgi:HAD superfamily hydrolase (TIGR01490 family)